MTLKIGSLRLARIAVLALLVLGIHAAVSVADITVMCLVQLLATF